MRANPVALPYMRQALALAKPIPECTRGRRNLRSKWKRLTSPALGEWRAARRPSSRRLTCFVSPPEGRTSHPITFSQLFGGTCLRSLQPPTLHTLAVRTATGRRASWRKTNLFSEQSACGHRIAAESISGAS
jgi:hypothetical protein